MLFNSYQFIFLFLLPLLAVAYYTPSRYILALFILSSIVFYAQWDLLHLSLLVSSILLNYTLSHYLSGSYKKPILFIAIVLNLTPLIFFKYSIFLTISNHSFVLPLAISFYTFGQITFLVDVYRKKISAATFGDYLFFTLFFPHLIAGPIIHYNDIISQVKQGYLANFDTAKLKAGLFFFSVGLFSKVVLADSLIKEHYLNWLDILSYSFMIYFDFSGYANMAIGLALMFGIVLPINFNSPYKARNIIDFWRRWHITLSNFLRDHIYIPLGGSKKGISNQIFALLLTMTIGGIWHGAGWQFLLWGFMHGAALAFVHIINFKLPKPISVILTFTYVTLLWVLFFSPSLSEALMLYKSLFSFEAFIVQKEQLYLLLLCAFIVWVLPNTSQLISLDGNIVVKDYYAYIAGVLFFISLKFMALIPASTFVYFNF